MGIINATIGAAGGVFADQWREFFYCDSLEADVLVVKGQKKTGGRSSNKRGEDNVISNGSIIAVADGQCAIIVDDGAIVDIVSEPGQFVYDQSSEPTIFYGGLSDGVKKSFETFGRRIGFGGDAGHDQRIYYFNTKELPGNRYGTPQPIPFRVVDNNIGLDIDVSVRCNGEYSYRISDPILFYKNVCGNVSEPYTRDKIDSQLKTEIMTVLQPSFARLSAMGIRYSELPGHVTELTAAINEELASGWRDKRGIEIVSFGCNSATISDEDADMIKQLQRSAVMRNPGMAAAAITSAQADAMKTAASNPNGAMMGFMGMNIAAATGGANAQQLFAQQQQQASQQSNSVAWLCDCGTQNTGNFCQGCGKKKPTKENDSSGEWFCQQCGTRNTGNFCQQCGARRC